MSFFVFGKVSVILLPSITQIFLLNRQNSLQILQATILLPNRLISFEFFLLNLCPQILSSGFFTNITIIIESAKFITI